MPRGQPGEGIVESEVSPEDMPRKLVPVAQPNELAGAGAGAAFGALGSAIDAKYKADSATAFGQKLSDFRVAQAQALDDAKAKAPAGDPGNFTDQYLAQFDKRADELRGLAENNPYGSRMVEKALGELRPQLAREAMGFEASQRGAYRIDAIKNGLDAQLPVVRAHPELADSIGSTLHDQLDASGAPNKLPALQEIDRQLTLAAGQGIADRDPVGTYNQLKDGGEVTDPQLARLIDPASRARVLEEARQGTVKGISDSVLASYRAGGPSTGQAAYANVDQLDLPDDVKDDIRRGVQERRGELIAEQQQAQAPNILAVEEQLRSKTPDPSTRSRIWDLYHSNAWSPQETGAALGALDRAQSDVADVEVGGKIIQDAYEHATPLDPKDKDVKSDADFWFQQQTTDRHLAAGSPGWLNVGADFAHRTGVIPESIGQYARAQLVGGQDPKQVQSAVEAVERMREAAPRAFEYWDDDKRLSSLADSIGRLEKAGMDPGAAIAAARANQERSGADRKRLEEAWTQAQPLGKGDQGLDSVLASAARKDAPGLVAETHWYGDTLPPRPYPMQADYATAVRAYFDQNGGNAQAARDSAARDLANVWGITRINGVPEYMRYPPERVFRSPDGSPGLTAEDVRNDVAQTVAAHPEAFLRFDPTTRTTAPFKPDPNDIKLVETPRTALTQGREFTLAYEDPNTKVTEQLFGRDGQPLTYQLPVSRSDYQAVRARELSARQAADAARLKAAQAAEAFNRKTLQDDLATRSAVFGGVP